MPFARVQVGVMPQPAQTKQRNMYRHGGGSSSSRPKGITMEDLKKQTALRLAQEQQDGDDSMHPNTEAMDRPFHQNHQILLVGLNAMQAPQKNFHQPYQAQEQTDGDSVHPNTEARDRPFRPLTEHQLIGYPNYPQVDTYSEQNPYQSHQIPPVGLNAMQAPQKNFHQPYQTPVHQNSNGHQMASYENYSTPKSQPGQYFDSKLVNSRSQRNQHVQHQLGSSSNPDSRSPKSRYLEEQRSHYHRASSAPNGTQPSQTNGSSKHDPSGSKTAKQKLPHGLTVHELKEMTKARLQAEVSDKHDTDLPECTFESRRGVSPLDFDSSIEVRERPMSRDSASRINHVVLHHGYASDSMSSIPSMVQVNQPNRDFNSGRQSHVSPLPPGFQNFGPINSSMPFPDAAVNLVAPVPGRESRQHQAKADAWETSSVTSHNGTVLSENLGSESAFSSGFGSGLPPQTESQMGGIPFTRFRSYPAGQGLGGDVSSHEGRSTPSSASPGNNGNLLFDAAPVAANRRRACTLSPKPGLIHEDRPHFGGEDLGMPNFSSSNKSTLLSRSRNNYSPVLGQLGLDGSRFAQNSGMVAFGDSFNRPRTSSATSLPVGDGLNRPRTYSATSLPPISRTADEFAMDRSNSFSRFSTSQPRARNDSLPEDLSSTLSEGVLGYSLISTGSEGHATGNVASNVFRDRPVADNRVPAPPGFLTDNELKAIDSNSSFGHYTAFSRVGSVDSVAESHLTKAWEGDGSLTGSGGQSLFSSTAVEESLANDMGSILKLSSVADRPDRERSNTYPHTSKTAAGAFVGGSFRY